MDEDCPLCDDMLETTNHLLCQCSVSDDVWGCASLEHIVQSRAANSFADFMANLLQQEPNSAVELFLTICWFIWLGRNDKVWQGTNFNAAQVASKGFQYLEEVERIRTINSHITSPKPPCQISWRAPPRGTIKLNVDGAVFSGTGRAGVGAVLRKHDGVVLRASTMKST